MPDHLPSAYVLNMQYTGLGIARSLGPRGVPVIGLMGSPHQRGGHSRHCRARRCPAARHEPAQLLAYLLDLGAHLESRAVLFPTGDFDVLFIAEHQEVLKQYFAFPLPDRDLVDTIQNKWTLHQKAQECGVPSPLTYSCGNPDTLQAAGREAGYPCILKPVYSYRWHQGNNWDVVGGRKAIKIGSPKELTDTYMRVRQADDTVLLQEFVPGDDSQIFVAGLYFGRHGDLQGGFTARKLAQYPPETGTGCLVEGTDNPEVMSLGTRLLQHVNYRGIAEVEFKRDTRDGSYKLIEINPRFWDQHRLGAACGVNLSYVAYRDLTGQPALPVHGQASGIYWVAARELIRHVGHGLRYRRALDLRMLWRLAVGKKEWALFAWDDPLPALLRS